MSEERHSAVHGYLRSQPFGFCARAAERAKVHRSMVYKVLHGGVVSSNVEAAIIAEEKASKKKPEAA